ncbi:MAG: biogenesis protein MshI [Pseudomonadota bacterium]
MGLELSQDSAAIAVRDGDEVRHGAIAVDEDAAFRRWIQAAGLDNCPCHAVLSPETITLLQVDRPAVPAAELGEAIRWSIKDSLDYPPGDAVIDCFDVPEDALRGRSPLVNVVAVNRRDIIHVVERVKSAGLSLQSIDIPELCLRNLAAEQQEADKAIAMLVIEGERGTMMIFRNGLLYLSRHITCDGGLSKGGVEPSSLAQVCLEIQRSLDYFESQLGQIPPRIILVHAGAATGSLVKAIDANLALATRRLGDDLTDAGLLRARGASLREDVL